MPVPLKRINTILVFVASIAVAVAAYDLLRPWPTRGEHKTVAARSCDNAIERLYTNLRATRRELFDAEQKNNHAWANALREDIEDITRRIKEIEETCKQEETA